jgi:hypothetical protein
MASGARSSASAMVATAVLALATGCERSKADGESTMKAAALASSAAADGGAGKDCCMGLNECKGKGGCAVPESHACRGQNECRGRGGCNAHCPK